MSDIPHQKAQPTVDELFDDVRNLKLDNVLILATHPDGRFVWATCNLSMPEGELLMKRAQASIAASRQRAG